MSAGTYNFILEQGTTFSIKLTLKDADGNLLDLTGDTFASQLRSSSSSPDVVAAFTFTILDQITNKGEVLMQMDAATSSAIPVKPNPRPPIVLTPFAYDVERTLPDNSVQRVIQGICSVSPDVTR